MSNLSKYYFPAETHTPFSLNTLQNPIPGLLTLNDSLTTANSSELTHIVSKATFTKIEGEIHHTIEQESLCHASLLSLVLLATLPLPLSYQKTCLA